MGRKKTLIKKCNINLVQIKPNGIGKRKFVRQRQYY